MKIKGITLVETITALAIFSLIALGTSMAFSTAGNTLRRCQDIQYESEESSEMITGLYNDKDASSEEYCILGINGNISITGEVFRNGEYIIVKSLNETEMGDDDGNEQEESEEIQN